MKYLGFLLSLSIVLASCGDDLPLLDNKLQLDGNNATAPTLPASNYETAVYFSASIMADNVDRQLREIEFYLYEEPAKLEVVIYAEGSVRTPGEELYRSSILNNLRTDRWNTHVLNAPLTLDGEPIWIGVRFETAIEQRTIGCDAGPNNRGGDHFINYLDGSWTTFQEFAGESINWNIRGDLVPD